MSDYKRRQIYSYEGLNGRGIFLVSGVEPLEGGKAILITTPRIRFIAAHSVQCLDKSNVELLGEEPEENMPDISDMYNTWTADCHKGCGVFCVPMAMVERLYLEAGAPPAAALYPCDSENYKTNKPHGVFIPTAASDSPAPGPP